MALHGEMPTSQPDPALTQPYEEGLAEEYVDSLGVDAVLEKPLYEALTTALRRGLPEGWTWQRDSAGTVYYWNELTGDSEWEHPDNDLYLAAVGLFRQVQSEAAPVQVLKRVLAELEAEMFATVDAAASRWVCRFTEEGEPFWHDASSGVSVWHDPHMEIIRRHKLRAWIVHTLLKDVEFRVAPQGPAARVSHFKRRSSLTGTWSAPLVAKFQPAAHAVASSQELSRDLSREVSAASRAETELEALGARRAHDDITVKGRVDSGSVLSTCSSSVADATPETDAAFNYTSLMREVSAVSRQQASDVLHDQGAAPQHWHHHAPQPPVPIDSVLVAEDRHSQAAVDEHDRDASRWAEQSAGQVSLGLSSSHPLARPPRPRPSASASERSRAALAGHGARVNEAAQPLLMSMVNAEERAVAMRQSQAAGAAAAAATAAGPEERSCSSHPLTSPGKRQSSSAGAPVSPTVAALKDLRSHQEASAQRIQRLWRRRRDRQGLQGAGARHQHVGLAGSAKQGHALEREAQEKKQKKKEPLDELDDLIEGLCLSQSFSMSQELRGAAPRSVTGKTAKEVGRPRQAAEVVAESEGSNSHHGREEPDPRTPPRQPPHHGLHEGRLSRQVVDEGGLSRQLIEGRHSRSEVRPLRNEADPGASKNNGKPGSPSTSSVFDTASAGRVSRRRISRRELESCGLSREVSTGITGFHAGTTGNVAEEIAALRSSAAVLPQSLRQERSRLASPALGVRQPVSEFRSPSASVSPSPEGRRSPALRLAGAELSLAPPARRLSACTSTPALPSSGRGSFGIGVGA